MPKQSLDTTETHSRAYLVCRAVPNAYMGMNFCYVCTTYRLTLILRFVSEVQEKKVKLVLAMLGLGLVSRGK